MILCLCSVVYIIEKVIVPSVPGNCSIFDCQGQCADGSKLGDGICNSLFSNPSSIDPTVEIEETDFACVELFFDKGDCVDIQATCGTDEV